MTRSVDKQAGIEEERPEGSMCGSDQEPSTSRKAAAFGPPLPMAKFIESATPQSPAALKMPPKTSPALDTGNNEFLRPSQLDYTILACEKRKSGQLTIRLLPEPETSSVLKYKRVAASTLLAPKRI